MSHEFYGFHITIDEDTFISDSALVNLDEPNKYMESMEVTKATK